MRTFFIAAVITLALAYARPARACQQCYEYFDYQSLDWCLYCAETNCGWEECNIVELNPGDESCSFAGEHCFTTSKHCPFEPQVELKMPKPLDQTWRLARVRVAKVSTSRKG
jgi:hypothetical protein